MNVTEVVMACIEHAPEASADLAESLVRSGRLGLFTTDILLKIIGGYSDNSKHAMNEGFYPSLAHLPEAERKRLTATLFDDYRPELLKRLTGPAGETDSDRKVRILNALVKLARLKGDDVVGWHSIGEPSPAERTWRFRDYDAAKDEQLHPRIGAPKRLRDTTLPKDMANWQNVAFDDSGWRSGKAPVGKGVHKARGHGRDDAVDTELVYENKSEWGEGEFIAMRTTFDLSEDDLKNDYYCLRILSPQGYDVYLNGVKIHSYIWFNSRPEYQQVMLGPDQIKNLKKGQNVLALRSVVGFEQDRDKEGIYHAIAQMDLYLDGLKKSELGL